MTDDEELDPLDWGPVYPDAIPAGYMPAPEPPAIAPPRGVLHAILHGLGVRRTKLGRLAIVGRLSTCRIYGRYFFEELRARRLSRNPEAPRG